MIYINGHEVLLDREERLEPWTSYDHVIWLAMDFIRRCPCDPRNGLPWYLQYSCFWTDPLRPAMWPDNPAGKAAWAVTTLIRYYPYSGERVYIDIIRALLDRLLAYHTPESWVWGGVPYASAEPGTAVYFGARADGAGVVEPDKIAQAACAYLQFYKLTGEEAYLASAIHCADVLVSQMRRGDAHHSPWPFRVQARDGAVVEEYTSDIVQMVRLFDELVQLGQTQYEKPRDAAWDWVLHYPMQTGIWKGYFEDIRLDPNNENREQLSPLETARYILSHREMDPEWRQHVPYLIEWVREHLGARPFFDAVAIHEQLFCYHVMGSHTARYASLCALWAATSGDLSYKERARRSFNWATYMANEDGTVTVGIDRPDYYNQCWFTDGYFDFVPHFLEGMAACPEWAPADRDHLLCSTSVVREVYYAPLSVSYHTFDDQASEVLRLTFEPLRVCSAGNVLPRCEALSSEPGWTFDPTLGVVRIYHTSPEVEILGR